MRFHITLKVTPLLDALQPGSPSQWGLGAAKTLLWRGRRKDISINKGIFICH